MTARPPVFVALALRLIALVSVLVPRRDRDAWRREWEAEILHGQRALDRGPGSHFGAQAALGVRALGSLADAAWLRRQVTTDSELVHDVRYALRLARRRPLFYLCAAAILAIGIGSTTAVFTMLDRLVLRALPYPEPDRLVSLWQRNAATGNTHEEVSPGNFLDWRAQATTFEGLASAEPFSVDYTAAGRPEALLAIRVSERFFDLLRVRPLHGRLFVDADHRRGMDRVALLTHRFWVRLGADPSIVGRTVQLDGVPFTVLGVLPRGADLNLFDGRDARDLFLPKAFAEYERDIRGEGWWTAIGRLAPGVSRAQAQADLDAISARLAAAHPRTNAATTVGADPLETHLTRTVRPALFVMLIAAALVLLIACANVANLMLLRGAERAREFSLRGALGASRARIVRQLLAEGATIVVAATVLGAALAAGLLRALVALAPVQSPRLQDLSPDAALIGIAVAIGGVTALLSSLAPAVQFSRRVRADALDTRGVTGPRGAGILRDGLVVSEVAVAVVLAVVVGLLGRSFVQLLRVDPGFSGRDVAVVQVFAYDRNNTPAKLLTFFRDVATRLRALPGVANVGAVSAMPFIEANINIESPFAIDGRPPAAAGQEPTTFLTVATPEYFDVMRIPVLAGRALQPDDRPTTEPVAVISRTLARKYWPDDDAVGARVAYEFMGQMRTVRIVGVMSEVRHDALELPARDELFVPFEQAPFGSITFVLRTRVDPAAVIGPAREAIWAVDPLQTIYDAGTVAGLLSASVAPRRFALLLGTAFGTVALLLAAMGIYAVMSVSTRQRTREIGVRLALGATRPEISRLVLRRGLTLGGVGLGVGLLLALGVGASLQSQLFAVPAFDPITIAAVAAIVVVVTAIACYAPARRATRVDPIVALRES